jgi:hypothetical protein
MVVTKTPKAPQAPDMTVLDLVRAEYDLNFAIVANLEYPNGEKWNIWKTPTGVKRQKTSDSIVDLVQWGAYLDIYFCWSSFETLNRPCEDGMNCEKCQTCKALENFRKFQRGEEF